MNILKKTVAGTVLGGALLVGGGLGLAHAAPPVPEAQTAGDGMVNVVASINGQEIGVLRDVTIANAAALAVSVCPVAGIDVNALTNLDVNGTVPANPCVGMTGLSFTFAQNVRAGEGTETVPGQTGERGNSQYAPGQNRDTATTPPSANPSTPPGQQGQQQNS